MVRAVLDVRVLVAAIRSDQGASRLLLTRALEQRLILMASLPLMVEYEAALAHPHHLAASGLSSHAMHALVDALAAVAEPVRLTPLWRPTLRDPVDDAVLEAAVLGAADAIVSLDDCVFRPAARLFGISVMSPAEAI
jgi:putative PIN family toxin of toxin-antitoxin system